MDPLWSETCWSILNIFKYFIIILIVSTNYIFVHLLDNKVFESSLMHGTNMKTLILLNCVEKLKNKLWVIQGVSCFCAQLFEGTFFVSIFDESRSARNCVQGIEFNNCPTRCNLFSLLHFCRQLYMFRALTPIIRSSYNCNYSFWYWLTGSTTIRSRCWVGTDPCVSCKVFTRQVSVIFFVRILTDFNATSSSKFTKLSSKFLQVYSDGQADLKLTGKFP